MHDTPTRATPLDGNPRMNNTESVPATLPFIRSEPEAKACRTISWMLADGFDVVVELDGPGAENCEVKVVVKRNFPAVPLVYPIAR